MHGYPQHGYPPPPPRSGMSALTIVLIIIIVMLVLGGGGCLLCIGLAASVDDGDHKPTSTSTATATPNGPQTTTLVRDKMAVDLETRLRAQGVPATGVLCPTEQQGDFECELTVGADRAQIQVKRGPTGFAFDVPNTAFLAGDKLATFFQANIGSKVAQKLTVPCFTGTLMKAVGSTFSCDVVSGTAPAGKVEVTVADATGRVKMEYGSTSTVPLGAAPAPAAKGGPRVVDFVCPPGQAPGGAVRAGCLCGSEILGTACGAPGNFIDVTATPRGCRFVCQ